MRGKKTSTRQSQTKRAGLIMPVARIHRKLKQIPQAAQRISKGASVYLSAVIEYLIAEISELGGNACRDNQRRRISPRHLMLAIRSDQELNQLFKNCILPGSGVLPNININLVNKTVDIDETDKPAAPVPIVVPKSPAPKRKPAKIAVDDEENNAKKESKNVTVLNERALASGQKLAVIQADITNVVADAIVHPTNNSFYLGGEVGSAIARAGGQEVKNLVNELHTSYGNLGVCSAAMSKASKKMLCENIIHVYSPSWDSAQQVERIDDLKKVVHNILTLSDTNKLKTVALPSISSGANGFPKQLAAQTILRAINEYFKKITTKSTIEKVIFVLYDAESVNIYTSELGKLSI